MIFDAFVFIASGLLALIAWVFGTVSIIIPDEIQSSLIYVFGYANLLQPVFPVDTLMTCFVLVLSVVVGKYAIVFFFRFIAPYIPFFGKQIEPFSQNTVDLRDTRGKLDLSHGKRPIGKKRWF